MGFTPQDGDTQPDCSAGYAKLLKMVGQYLAKQPVARAIPLLGKSHNGTDEDRQASARTEPFRALVTRWNEPGL